MQPITYLQHMAQSLNDILSTEHFRKSLDLLASNHVAEFLTRLCHIRHPIGEVALQDGGGDGETAARFQLVGEVKKLRVAQRSGLRIQVNEHEDLRAPIFGVRRLLAERYECLLGGRHAEAASGVTPFFGGSAKRRKGEENRVEERREERGEDRENKVREGSSKEEKSFLESSKSLSNRYQQMK